MKRKKNCLAKYSNDIPTVLHRIFERKKSETTAMTTCLHTARRIANKLVSTWPSQQMNHFLLFLSRSYFFFHAMRATNEMWVELHSIWWPTNGASWSRHRTVYILNTWWISEAAHAHAALINLSKLFVFFFYCIVIFSEISPVKRKWAKKDREEKNVIYRWRVETNGHRIFVYMRCALCTEMARGCRCILHTPYTVRGQYHIRNQKSLIYRFQVLPHSEYKIRRTFSNVNCISSFWLLAHRFALMESKWMCCVCANALARSRFESHSLCRKSQQLFSSLKTPWSIYFYSTFKINDNFYAVDEAPRTAATVAYINHFTKNQHRVREACHVRQWRWIY